MGSRRQTRDLNQAAERLEEATQSLAAVMGQLIEFERTRMMYWREEHGVAEPEASPRGLRDFEAVNLAVSSVRRAREERDRTTDKDSPPSEQEIARWNDDVLSRREAEGF